MYEWSNGAKYVGEHDLDQRTGFGTMIYPDGAEFSGIWENGVHVKFQDSPDQDLTTTSITTRRMLVRTTASTESTTSEPEVTTRRRKKVIRRRKGKPDGESGGKKKRTRRRKKVKKQRKGGKGLGIKFHDAIQRG